MRKAVADVTGRHAADFIQNRLRNGEVDFAFAREFRSCEVFSPGQTSADVQRLRRWKQYATGFLAVAGMTRIDEVGPLEPVLVLVMFGPMRRVKQNPEAEASFTQSFRQALQFERSYGALRTGQRSIQ